MATTKAALSGAYITKLLARYGPVCSMWSNSYAKLNVVIELASYIH